MNRIIAVGLLVLATQAFASADEDAAQAGNGPKANMGPTQWGDPMKIADTTVLHPTVDVSLHTSLGPFQLRRTFFSNKYTWSKGASTHLLFPPYGEHPNNQDSVEWTHNLFSYVIKAIEDVPVGEIGDPYYAVRDVNGTYIRFDHEVSVSGGASVLAPSLDDTSGARMYMQLAPPAKFIVVRPGQGRFIYNHKVTHDQKDYYFLTAIEGEQYDHSTTGYSVTNGWSLGPTQATLTYNGTKIDVVTLVDGQSLKFYYNTNGTLDRIELRNKQQTTSVVVAQYSYASGRLSGVSNISGRSEAYTYGSGGAPEFKVVANSLLVTKKSLATSAYAETNFDETPDRTIQVLRNTPPSTPANETDCSVNSLGACRNNWRTWLQQTPVFEGDGTGTQVTVETRHFYRPSIPAQPPSTPAYSKDQTTRQREVCTKSGGACKAFTDQIAYWVYAGYTTDVASYTDRLGNIQSNTWAAPSSGATPFPAVELTQISSGGAAGYSALHALNKSYEYAGAGRSALRFYEQQVATESETSVVPGCGTTKTTTYKRNTNTNYLEAVFQTGCTRSVTGAEQGSATVKHIATFYFKHYKCEGGSTDDPLGRTLEVHGPCFVTGTSATDCNAGGIIPITQYEYWSPSETSDRANRLKRKSSFTNNTSTSCPGTRLDTTYNTYDAFGQVLSETDPNGTVTTRTFTGQRIGSETTAGGSMTATKTYTYDATTNQLTSIQLPAGNFEVYCYQTGIAANAACSGGTPTDKLMWKAIASTATGANPVERVDYTYANGKVATESYFEGGATTATRTKKYEADPLGRPTYEQWGSGTGSYFGAKRFDAEGRPVLSGLPYNHPDGLCENEGPSNRRCVQTFYDRLGRVETTIGNTGPTSSYPTYFGYDYQSNLTSLASGFGTLVNYEYDDFGRLIAFQGSWTGIEGSANAAKALQDFDAAGNLTTRWMPGTSGSQLETWTYDSLSRIREVKAGTTLLWNNYYDGDVSPHSNCPAVSSSKLRGRLQVKGDSFGNSWYQYDDFGNILKIRRQRGGSGTTPSCSGAGQESANNTPDSEFTYTSDGRLLAEKYPHGRKLEYVYGSSGKQHRIVAIKAAIGSSTMSNLIQDIDYYAFGGMKTYQFATTGGATTVNSLIGDIGTSELATTCSALTPPSGVGDLTGRTRMLQVIRSTTNIFRRAYRWDADQPAEEKTCLLDDSTPTTLTYGLGSAKGFDGLLRLQNVSRPANELANRGGPFQQRTFTYDSSGARTSLGDSNYTFNETVGSHGRLIASTLAASGTSHLNANYTYDLQGRMNGKLQYQGLAGWGRTVYPVPDDGQNGAVGAVYKQIIVNGATYEYFYDSAGRRRFKSYPLGANDEFFHHGSNLIEDRGSEVNFRPQFAPLDEYVWLDGKPVALIKVKLDSDLNYGVTADRTGVCTRFTTEDVNCGVYFIVSDYLGKPVLMLNEAGQVTGTGEYDSFGLVNTVTHPAETNLYGAPYANNQSLTLATFNQQPTAAQVTRMRARFGQVSTHFGPKRGGYYLDYVEIVNSTGGALTPPYAGYNLGSFKSPWFAVPSSGGVVVRFTSDADSEAGYDGVVVDGYEYQRFQTGAQPVWTALRFPGQYFDLETEFAENWNRFYDARDGRYTAADPARSLLADGNALSPYTYADNNPIVKSDPTGKVVPLILIGVGAALALTWKADDVVVGSDGKSHGGCDIGAPMAAMGGIPAEIVGLISTAQKIDAANASGDKDATIDAVKAGVPSRAPRGVDFVAFENGEAAAVPKGATGPTPTLSNRGKENGWAYTGGQGGENGQVATMRYGDPRAPTAKDPAGAPHGYIKYENANGQGVSPVTGKTVPHSQSHLKLRAPTQ